MVDFDKLIYSLSEEIEEPELEKKARIQIYWGIELVSSHSNSTIIFDIQGNKYGIIHIQDKNLTILGRHSQDPINDVLLCMKQISKGDVTVVYARKWLTTQISTTSLFANWDNFYTAQANPKSFLLKKFNWKTENPTYTIREKFDRNGVLKGLYYERKSHVVQIPYLREPETFKPTNTGQFRIDEIMA